MINTRVKEIAERFNKAGHEIFLVGGSVRDLVMMENIDDYDFCTDANPDKIEQILIDMSLSIYNVGKKYGTISTSIDGINYEITTFRSEKYLPGNRKPFVDFEASLDKDLSRRDFTVNAMAVDIHSSSGEMKIIDLYDGMLDLRNEIIKSVEDPVERIVEDPLRMMRAIRFVCTLPGNFKLDTELKRAIKERSMGLSFISKERIRDELNKILLSDKPAEGIKLLVNLGLMEHIIPEILNMINVEQPKDYHFKDVYGHTLLVLNSIKPSLSLRLAALLHDVGKPETMDVINGEIHFYEHDRVGGKKTKRILRDLRYPKDLTENVAFIVKNHMRMLDYSVNWPDRSIRRLIDRCTLQNNSKTLVSIDDMLELFNADLTSSNFSTVETRREMLDTLKLRVKDIEKKIDITSIKSPVDGDELIKMFKLPPGKWIRDIKKHLKQKVIDGEIMQNDKVAARAELYKYITNNWYQLELPQPELKSRMKIAHMRIWRSTTSELSTRDSMILFLKYVGKSYQEIGEACGGITHEAIRLRIKKIAPGLLGRSKNHKFNDFMSLITPKDLRRKFKTENRVNQIRLLGAKGHSTSEVSRIMGLHVTSIFRYCKLYDIKLRDGRASSM